MNISESERKFLVTNDGWKKDVQSSELLQQKYLVTRKNLTQASIILHPHVEKDKSYAELKLIALDNNHEDFIIKTEDLNGYLVLESLFNLINNNSLDESATLNKSIWQTRLRMGESGGWITIKGPREGITNPEYEFSISLKEGQLIWDNHPGESLRKIRHKIPTTEGVWEVDEFLDDALNNLVMAEFEMPNESYQFEIPAWVGVDVSENAQYRNDTLAKQVANYKKPSSHKL